MTAVKFGPQLIGQTEKALSALLRAALDGTQLNEAQWVSLRLAEQVGATDAASLAVAIADGAHFDHAPLLVEQLAKLGLVDGGHPTAVGLNVLATGHSRIDAMTGALWTGFDPNDVSATERVLREVIRRATSVLASSPD